MHYSLQLGLALAVVCGLVFFWFWFLFWFFRLAFVANFLSRAVLAGFITGLSFHLALTLGVRTWH